MAGLNQEIWTGVMVEQFRATEEALFLNEIPDESRWVTKSPSGENEVIHLTDIGVDPDVLINNSTYPIPYQTITDSDIAISMDKFQTKVTPVTLDEIRTISYDKIKKTQEKHTRAIMKIKHRKALHAMCPAANTATTPVLVTTGTDDGTGRKRLLYKDLATLKSRADDAGIDEDSRVLVLCSDHYNDLVLEGLEANSAAKGGLINASGGNLNIYILGFKIYWFVNAPYIKPSTLGKVAFGAVPVAGDQKASTFFVRDDMFKAMGSTQQFHDEPTARMQQHEYSARHFYMCMPKKLRAVGAIVSDNVA